MTSEQPTSFEETKSAIKMALKADNIAEAKIILNGLSIRDLKHLLCSPSSSDVFWLAVSQTNNKERRHDVARVMNHTEGERFLAEIKPGYMTSDKWSRLDAEQCLSTICNAWDSAVEK